MKRVVIAIPSYKRPEPVKTLEIFPHAKVFVASKEAEAYKQANPNANIVVVPDGVQGNLCRVRNYILDTELNENTAVVIVDDDISCFRRLTPVGNAKKFLPIPNELMPDMVANMANVAEEWGYSYFGMACNSDLMVSRFTKPFATVAYIGGPFQGFLPSNKCRYDERLPLKEDYDMTIQQCEKERGCLRFNLYCYDAKQSEQSGGCASYRTILAEKEQLEMLRQKWGDRIVRIDTFNKGAKSKKAKLIDYNPIINIPIKGI